MTTTLCAYLSFDGTAREAMTYYREVFGGELTLSTFGEFGATYDAAQKDLVMHGELKSDGLTLMGADSQEAASSNSGNRGGFSVALFGDDDAVLRAWWAKLIDGGSIVEPLVVAPWGDAFGMCVDRFGTPWMVNISAPAA